MAASEEYPGFTLDQLSGITGTEEKEMNLQNYIEEAYGAAGEKLFAKYPGFRVFRHESNRKWFAVIMEIPREKLGISGGGDIPVVNVKCDTRLIGSFRQEQGIFPAYHMSKAHWLSVALDGTVDEDKIKFLVDMSYDLTRECTCGNILPAGSFESDYEQ